ncbi:urease accessory protein UreD [Paenibacillus sambharensis]|uniref:Urease accessory protein UreD n=1 Tax=Paenibacillus sambharensis TaxID=1803190 RepID=A0A2W1LI35_9BACL|nr:urease accessory protein UreD [Paenibacillus sambharensis]PZD94184.1 urease accessory protein UreD [Paenibacillus sambharensis]
MPRALPIPTEQQREEKVSRTSFLRAEFDQQGGKTVMTGKYQTAPVKIAKTFDYSGELAAIVMDASPGMLEGDIYQFDWRAGPGTSVYVTNQSYTKVHPCKEGAGAVMQQRFKVEEGALMQSMMEPIMLYRGAALMNESEVQLGNGAVWMQAEVLSPGRLLRGESFVYRKLDNRLKVYHGDELIFYQRQLIEPGLQQLKAPGSWEEQTHLGTLYAFSDRINAGWLETVRAALEELPEEAGAHAVLAGASLTSKHGLGVLAAGRTAWQLQRTLQAVWTALRQERLQAPPLRLLS